MSGRQLRGPPAAGACWLLLCALGAVYRASEGFCPDPQATNYHPDALQEHAQDCEYSCLETVGSGAIEYPFAPLHDCRCKAGVCISIVLVGNRD